jgi:hypothetical protein
LRSATLARCATGHDRPESLVTIAGIPIEVLKHAAVEELLNNHYL